MRIIARSTLRDFWKKHPDAEQALKAWFHEVEKVTRKSPHTITHDYPTASVLPDDRVGFRIKGNHYRIVVKVNYHYGIVYIRFVGTHTDYDDIDAKTI